METRSAKRLKLDERDKADIAKVCESEYRYDSNKSLGSGTYGTVYAAFTHQSKYRETNKYAVKVYEKKYEKAFHSEVKALSFLQNKEFKHMPHFYGSFECDNKWFIVTELLNGDLHNLLHEKPMESVAFFNQILDFIRRAVLSLYAIHSTHDDIHAGNIMYRSIENKKGHKEYQFYLIDFNMAKTKQVLDMTEEEFIMDQCTFAYHHIVTYLCIIFGKFAILDLDLYPENKIFESSMELVEVDKKYLESRNRMVRIEKPKSTQLENYWWDMRIKLKKLYELKNEDKMEMTVLKGNIGALGYVFKASINDREYILLAEEMLYLGFKAQDLIKTVPSVHDSYRMLKKLAEEEEEEEDN